MLLQLLVETDGSVGDLQLLEGAPPFSDAALEAATSWQFSPARQGHEKRSARIRFELRFVEPTTPAPVTEESGDRGPTPASAAPPPAATVTVRGRRKPVGTRSLTRAEVRQLPGAFGDPFRAIEALPGVTPLASGVPFFYVRGAPPGNVGYFLDGIRVPLLYHVGLGPSVVHPGMVSSVELYPGAYPARYGRFGGGIVAGLTTEPSDELRGEWQVRLFDAGAMLEMPFADGRGQLLFGGRYSYTAAMIALFADNVRLEYWDYQLRASYRVGDDDTLGVFAFGSFDYFGEDTGSGDDDFLGTEFHRIDLRHERLLSGDGRLQSALTLGYDRTRGGDDAAVVSPNVALRSRFEGSLSSSLTLEAGASITLEDFRVEIPEEDDVHAQDTPPGPGTIIDGVPFPDTPPGSSAPNPEDLARFEEARRRAQLEQEQRQEGDGEGFERSFPTRTDAALGAFVQTRWQATSRIELTTGLRLDAFTSDGAWAASLDPRISAAFQVGENWTLTHTLGLAHQPPSFVIPVPGFQMGGLRGGLQRSVQHSAGVIRKLPDEMHVSATLFHNQFYRLSDLLSLVRSVDADELEVDSRTRGRSYGLELLFRRSLTRKLGGFLSYTLSRSDRYTPNGRIVAAFDRPHVLSAALGYDLGRGWRIGGRLSYYSGTPADTTNSEENIDLSGFASEIGVETPVLIRDDRPARLPSFHRLDVRLEKRWWIGDSGASFRFVFEVLNTTLNSEVVGLSCGQRTMRDASGQWLSRETCAKDRIGPVTIPSIGIEGSF